MAITESVLDRRTVTAVAQSRGELLAAVRGTGDELARLEARRLVLVAGLCDAYAQEEAQAYFGDDDPTPHVLHGEQIVFPGAAGTPGVQEFFHLELAMALGCSPESAQVWIADTINLRHRHPVLWGLVVAGEVPVWVARQVTRNALALDFPSARRFDAEHGARMGAWSPARCFRVTQECARVRSTTEEHRRQAWADREVRFSPSSRTAGLTLLEASLDSIAAAHLDRTLDRVADVLQLGGSTDTRGARRSDALGHLAHPDRARLLLSESLLDGGNVTPEGDVVTTDGEIVTADHERCRHGAQIVLHLRPGAPGAGASAAAWSVSDDHAPFDEHGRRSLGPIVQDHLAELLGGCTARVNVRPVVDLNEPVVLSQYRPNAELSWRIRTRDQQVMYPHSNRSSWSRGTDLDHTRPWPQGETEQANLGTLSRTIHRAKTHGGFTLTQSEDGTFCWRTPAGQTAWVNAHGTWRTPPPSVLTVDPADTTARLRDLLHEVSPRPNGP